HEVHGRLCNFPWGSSLHCSACQSCLCFSPARTKMLRIEGVRLAYPGRILVEGLSAEFRAGEIWAVLGRNGSGKSTLLHALAALRRPQAGRVLLNDATLQDMPRRALARHVGVLLQEESREFW